MIEKTKYLALCMALSVSLSAPQANARPVSYPGGVTVIATSDSAAHSVLTHYSPTARYAIGHRFEYQRDDNVAINALQLNILAKRWNGKHSQANLYWKGGIGAAHANGGSSRGKSEPAAFGGFAADWEDRRTFVSYENRGLHTGEIGRGFTQRARVGVAPYVGDYGDIHTWLMLEVKHTPQAKDNFRVTPLVRLFKGVGLVEAGIDNQGDALFNFTYRF